MRVSEDDRRAWGLLQLLTAKPVLYVCNVDADAAGTGNALSARVPFCPRTDEIVTLALELPDELVIALEARVEEVEPAADGRKTAVRLDVFGLTCAVRQRLSGLVRDGRRGGPAEGTRQGPTRPF